MASPDGRFVLFLKAGRNDRGPSACPRCQHAHMAALLRAPGAVEVRYVDARKPLPDERHVAKRLPALVPAREPENEDAVVNADDVAAFLHAALPGPELCEDDREAVAATLSVFSKFCCFLRDLATSARTLEAELDRVDKFLGARPDRRFLCGDTLADLDCALMPKLHCVRVASARLKGYELPGRFRHLWGYLGHAYAEESFRRSCPPDEEIVHFFGQKVVMATSTHFGCNLMTCGNLSLLALDSYEMNQKYFVCQFSVKVNDTVRPYVAGQPCTCCPVGYNFCENNMCSKTNSGSATAARSCLPTTSQAPTTTPAQTTTGATQATTTTIKKLITRNGAVSVSAWTAVVRFSFLLVIGFLLKD